MAPQGHARALFLSIFPTFPLFSQSSGWKDRITCTMANGAGTRDDDDVLIYLQKAEEVKVSGRSRAFGVSRNR